MNKINSNKVIAIRVPEPLMEKFKSKCNDEFKTMSEVIKDFIRDYIKGDHATNN